MKLSNERLNELKAEIPAEDIIGKFVRLQRDGQEYIGLCPFHQEKTPSFRVYQHDNGVGLFKCFGCGAHGNVFQFVQKVKNISFNDAVEETLRVMKYEVKHESEKVFKSMSGGKEYVTYPLASLTEAERRLAGSVKAREWIENRGLDFETVQALHWGFMESADTISPNHPWVDKGWILIPTITDGVVTCVQLRSLVGKKTGEGKSGILRAPNMRTSLYNLDAVDSFDDVFVVEGPPDVAAMASAGYTAVALPSAEYTMTPEERSKLERAPRIFLAGDTDAVGRVAMRKLWSEFRNHNAYLIEWPKGTKDANDALQKMDSIDAFQNQIEGLKTEALGRPMEHVFDLKQTMATMDRMNPFDDPQRLHMPWPSIDQWAAIVPGDVMSLFATESKMGKTTFLLNILMWNAIKYSRVIVNYSAELSPAQYARRAVAYLTGKDRNHLTEDDYREGMRLLGEARFYNGYKPGAHYKDVIALLTDAKVRLGADIVVIDHLHFLTRGKDENANVAEAMRMLKDFAVDYNVIVIVVGQPRKGLPTQRGREATSQDAKSSEAFGSDASQVFILHRSRVSQSSEGDPIFSDICKVKLDYSRESETRWMNLRFEGNTCRFLEQASEIEEALSGDNTDTDDSSTTEAGGSGSTD